MSIIACNPKPAATAQSCCVVCGDDNPRGLRIKFQPGPDGGVQAEWEPTEDWEGYEGIVHGGILSTVLDEAMSKAVAEGGTRAFTCELRVRYRQLVNSGERLVIRGWIVDKRRRRITTEASLSDSAGNERVHAWGTFLEVVPS